MNDYDYSNTDKGNVQKIEIVGLDRLTSAIEVLAGIKPIELAHLQMRKALFWEETKHLEPEEVNENISKANTGVGVELGEMIENFELTGKWKKENEEPVAYYTNGQGGFRCLRDTK